jgi:threonine dehydratase
MSVSVDDVLAARERIRPFVHTTPLMSSSTLSALAGRNVLFKCEALQKTGSFKARGACSALTLLGADGRARGVCTHSSGNHGQALAFAARALGCSATIVMPSNSPAVKKAAVDAYGAVRVDCEPTQAAREAAAARVVDETGAVFVHPYNDRAVIAGQGTVAVEMIEQAEAEGAPLDAIVVPIGGGGLTSGITVAAKALRPGIRIIAAEPLAADDASRSKAAGELLPHASPPVTVSQPMCSRKAPWLSDSRRSRTV